MKAHLYGIIFISSISVGFASQQKDSINERDGLHRRSKTPVSLKVNLGSFKSLEDLFAFAKSCQKARQSQKNNMADDAKFDPSNLARLLEELGGLPPLPKLFLPPEFKVGDMYRIKSHPDIYLQYVESIDITRILGFPCIDRGFKVFRTMEKDEIGYIVPNYIPKEHKICIAALWIKEAFRSKGFGTKVVSTLIGLFNAKSDHFPEANRYTFSVQRGNKPMIKIAQKLGFIEASATQEEKGLHDIFGGMEFMKPFSKKD